MKDWMISITFFMLLCSLIHNIIPNKSYKKYFNFIMGIIMIVLVLKPVSFIMSWDDEKSIIYYADSLEEYLDKSKNEEGSYYDYYEMSLEKALMSYLFQNGYEVENVEIIKDKDNNIIKITIWTGYTDEKNENNIKKSISQFYNLKMNSIYVVSKVS